PLRVSLPDCSPPPAPVKPIRGMRHRPSLAGRYGRNRNSRPRPLPERIAPESNGAADQAWEEDNRMCFLPAQRLRRADGSDGKVRAGASENSCCPGLDSPPEARLEGVNANPSRPPGSP